MTKDLTEARIPLTEALVKKLREAAAAFIQLADHLEATPGDALGPSYGRIWDATREAQTAMMQYQHYPGTSPTHGTSQVKG